MAAALFATQPLLFGHAFINQKDTPFLAFFLISVVVGMHTVDRLPTRRDGQIDRAQESGWRRVRRAWGGASLSGRILLMGYLLVGILLLVELASPDWRAARLTAAALAAQRQGLWVPLQALADTLASGSVEPAGYLVGLSWLHDLGRLILVLAWLALARSSPAGHCPKSEGCWMAQRGDGLCWRGRCWA